MSTNIDLDAWKRWPATHQARALELLKAAQREDWRPFYCKKPDCDGKPHDEWEWNHARADQHPPKDLTWVTWLMMSGRGAGKTRAGAELTHRMTEVTNRIAIVGATSSDVRDICLEGESGLLTIAGPGRRPRHEPSKRRLTWPNGCIGTTFSAEEPDRLRGPEHGFAWLDEPVHWTQIQDCWDNLMFGLRIGKRPRVVCTTTPKPRPWLKELIAAATTRITKASTYSNIDNLAPTFAELIIAKYQNTRLGRQELYGEVLEDVEGALWTWDLIEPDRVPFAPHLERVVIGVDPAGGAKPSNDETGIIVVGIANDHLYTLADRSGRYSPHGWATAVDAAHDEFGADAVVAEKNYGGDMVTHTLQSSGVTKRVITVDSRRGKAIRAEPIVGVYEQHRAHHVGVFADLEDELTTWQPYEDKTSPNRLDALVHGCTNLLGKRAAPSSVATPDKLRKRADDIARERALEQARRHLGRHPVK